ncbi:4-hydroxybenzoate polyprenyltransferase [Natronoarchaeum philippinense]|uniref:4-hydroxybenzoate polyprenyltransferase n=1 Tax=Natronoarchaeum philippinense TaxID=558529 RepID=A0A285PA09_NATPI|nr:prenyltransferase [Natronoarchaeum philippinense]SNZ18087.1 4-hydroxybenzoate polyprenyltransferase [Natronoarchaeum philippinense]
MSPTPDDENGGASDRGVADASDGDADDDPATGQYATLGAKLRRLFVLSRPRFWLYLAGPVLVGAVYGASELSDLASPLVLALFAYFLLPANVFLYGINDVYDADIDAENPKKEADAREARFGGEPFVVYAVAVCALAAVALIALVPDPAQFWLVGFVILGSQYSAPPLRFKTTPLLDSVSNGLYILPGAAAYAALAGAQPPTLAIAGGWLWAMGMHTFSAIPDIEPDRQAGIETTATRLGERATYAYCALTWALAAAAFGAVDLRLGVALLVYPLLAVGVPLGGIAVDRAYWWFPAINTVVGAALTMGGLWVLAGGLAI